MIEIADRKIGPGEPTYVVAECGVAHNGRIDLALKLVDAAKRAGADACKWQVWRTSRLLAPESPQYRKLLPLELSYGQIEHIQRHCDDVGITFFATPDQPEDADFLETLGVPAYKIGSGHVTDLRLLSHVAAFGKPIILSTGMSDMEQVGQALQMIDRVWRNPFGIGPSIVLLHCVSVYHERWEPAGVNLKAMDALRQFGYPVGFSDHSPLDCISLAAVARGACVIERHLMLNETTGPDRYVSLAADRFGAMTHNIRYIEAALGDGVKRPMPAEEATAAMVREWRR